MFVEGGNVLGRIKVLVAVVAAMTMLMMVAAPAMADDWNWKDRHHDNDRHDYFIDYYEDFYDDFECEFLGYYDGEAIFACELD